MWIKELNDNAGTLLYYRAFEGGWVEGREVLGVNNNVTARSVGKELAKRVFDRES